MRPAYEDLVAAILANTPERRKAAQPEAALRDAKRQAGRILAVWPKAPKLPPVGDQLRLIAEDTLGNQRDLEVGEYETVRAETKGVRATIGQRGRGFFYLDIQPGEGANDLVLDELAYGLLQIRLQVRGVPRQDRP